MNCSAVLRKDIDVILIEKLRAGEDVLRMKDILQQYKDSGVSKEEMIEYLEGMRSKGLKEKIDDGVLELLDISRGFCSPNLRVW